MDTLASTDHKETRPVTQDTVREQSNAAMQATNEDNVVTRAQQGHLSLLDWQAENPLQEQSRMPRVRRGSQWDWYTAGIVTLMVSAALAGAELLAHLAG